MDDGGGGDGDGDMGVDEWMRVRGCEGAVRGSLAPDALVSGLATFGSFLAARLKRLERDWVRGD